MTTDPLVQNLLKIALFHGLEEGQLRRIAADAERCMFVQGDVITTAGADANAAFLIVAGPALYVPDHPNGEPQPVVPGSLVGEMAMLIEHTYGATVIARGQVRALKLNRAVLHQHMLDDARLAEHLMHKVAERLVHVASELRRIDRILADATVRPAQSQHAQAAPSRHLGLQS